MILHEHPLTTIPSHGARSENDESSKTYRNHVPCRATFRFARTPRFALIWHNAACGTPLQKPLRGHAAASITRRTAVERSRDQWEMEPTYDICGGLFAEWTDPGGA
jgi:hypothetical protein